jgi:DNA-binding XRE family transcriptional regulator
MDRRKKHVDTNALRKLRAAFYDKIDANELTLFDAVKEMRKISNLTQPEFANFSGVSVKIIKDMESNKGNPTLKTLRQLGEFFGLDLAYTRKNKQ